MFLGRIQFQCECARDGKSVYHTVPWLRAIESVTCAGCSNSMLTIEVLRCNINLVRESDGADRRALS